MYRLDYNTIGSALRNATKENQLFTINEGTYSIPVIVGEEENWEKYLLGVEVINKEGVRIPLSTVLKETRIRDLKNIVSGKSSDYYPLNFSLPDKQVKEVIKNIDEVANGDEWFDVTFTGSYFSNRQMIKELIVILTVALLLLFFILAAQFESLIQPLIILSEIVTDIFAALFLLWICGSGLNLMSMIGLVVMSGIIINDSILKVDTINRLRKEGYSLIRALMTGGSRRLKPIIMTSLTTVLAIAPFLVRGDMGSDLQYPLSLAIIGGMVAGTFVSIFFIPVFYYNIYKKRSK
jgi:multidrug efflux pump subunit AcrB